MSRCCCGNRDIDEPVVVNEYRHEPLGDPEAFCGLSYKHEIRDLIARVDKQDGIFHRLLQWADAYPLAIFPEPDFKKAAKVLKDNGMTLDAISASNMRHVITRVKELIGDGRTG